MRVGYYVTQPTGALFEQRLFSGMMFPVMTFAHNEAEFQFVRPKKYEDMRKSAVPGVGGSCLEITSEYFLAMIQMPEFAGVRLENFAAFQAYPSAYVHDCDAPRITYGNNNFEVCHCYQGPAISEKLADRLDRKIFIAVVNEKQIKKKRILFYLVLPPKSDVKVL